ncbi:MULTISPECIES: DUF4388 domain-containing protein [Moorena]|uniref:PatA-like N-terminal domain-containing protein n=1 Tax=Moorena producens 3L TaxID=489825 RepID=F4XPH5_9CYAN|nr:MULTISPECIES: DUF4388 domain-containing protein [Moorena]EGJ33429.1 hypothetical protein LYNGBM3L_34870 [Moorena producens 3L]NEP31474.1 DUF4388 domain-containing protein [Moorena sp. SIO3B2]NEP65212.1 DUF4388 domain-containing protein [Moorena sp. SIO3A5]NEQ08753.1 DUF4388 domain-containing protein [Moorena sp. SIO4E2]NER87212.1 DUF4388 domain-containing protein [Moorena sp. SIO3A2]
MSVTGHLTDISLPEVFQFIAQGQKTGLLRLLPLPINQATPRRIHYIWVYQGHLVAAADRLDNQGLVSLIVEHCGVSERVIAKLAQLCAIDKPLGLCLRTQGALQGEQLKQLFRMQILQHVCALFQLRDGQFNFEQNVPIPTREMTGLSIPTKIAMLKGLRSLRNWQALADKLPDPNGGLVSINGGQPKYSLDSIEWQVWEYTNGNVSLKRIARQLRLPVEKVQQVAFRLITTGLVEEVPLLVSNLCDLSTLT